MQEGSPQATAIAASSAQKPLPAPPAATSAPTVPARKPGQTKSSAGGSFSNAACTLTVIVTARLQDGPPAGRTLRSEEHTSELQSRENLVCRLLLEKKKMHAVTLAIIL